MIKKLASKYYWVILLAIVILGSIWLDIRAWNYLHEPIILDYFYNPTLKMYEPVELIPLPEVWNVIMLMPTVFLMWWHSPIYFQIPYTISFAWLVFLLWAYRPCIDIPLTRVASSKEEMDGY